MRISDWSSDVCSSDRVELQNEYNRQINQLRQVYGSSIDAATARALGLVNRVVHDVIARGLFRSEERRGGQACVSPCRSRWSPSHYKQKSYTSIQNTCTL